MRKKILLAAGGTGGHLFPAQRLASQLMERGELDVLIAGAGLGKSPYFDRSSFSYRDITSGTPFRGGALEKMKVLCALAKGTWQSLCLLGREKPDLMVGFGSFHSFPLLVAAKLKKVPLVLFESNAVPGKVVRLFSGKAVCTALYFPEAGEFMRGRTAAVEIPSLREHRRVGVGMARAHFGLEEGCLTLLAFGGSQGAKGINQLVKALIPRLKRRGIVFQLLHFTGHEEEVGVVESLCRELGIKACVKKFEKEMDVAWSAADIAITRAGALTVSEVLDYGVPTLFVPYPYAAEQHQLKNAQLLATHLKGIHVFEEAGLVVEAVEQVVEQLADRSYREERRQEIEEFRLLRKGRELVDLVLDELRV